MLRLRKKKSSLRVLHIAKPDWGEEDALIVRQLVKSPTFPRLVAILNGFLIQNMINNPTTDEGRTAYLRAIQDIANIGNFEKPVADSDEMVTMAESDE